MAGLLLSGTQRYAAGTLLAIAVHQAQIHQSGPLKLGIHDDNDHHNGNDDGISNASSNSSSDVDSVVSQDPHLWVHPNSSLLRPIFQFLEIDASAWTGIEQTAASSYHNPTHHVGPFLRLLSEDTEDLSPENKDREFALAKGVDSMEASILASADPHTKRDQQRQYAQERREKCSVSDTPDERQVIQAIQENTDPPAPPDQTSTHTSEYQFHEHPVEEHRILTYEKKITLLYELLSGSLATMSENTKKSKLRKGYDARHRVALRLLATWLDISWIKVEAIALLWL